MSSSAQQPARPQTPRGGLLINVVATPLRDRSRLFYKHFPNESQTVEMVHRLAVRDRDHVRKKLEEIQNDSRLSIEELLHAIYVPGICSMAPDIEVLFDAFQTPLRDIQRLSGRNSKAQGGRKNNPAKKRGRWDQDSTDEDEDEDEDDEDDFLPQTRAETQTAGPELSASQRLLQSLRDDKERRRKERRNASQAQRKERTKAGGKANDEIRSTILSAIELVNKRLVDISQLSSSGEQSRALYRTLKEVSSDLQQLQLDGTDE